MIHFQLNGRTVQVDDSERNTPLIHVLRGADIGDMTPKLGCGLEQCGTCRVLLDGEAVYACALAAGAAAGREVETAAGLDTPVRRALIATNATQCGICLPGIIVAAEALFRADPQPDRARIKEALDPQLCRCGSHPRVLRALLRLTEA